MGGRIATFEELTPDELERLLRAPQIGAVTREKVAARIRHLEGGAEPASASPVATPPAAEGAPGKPKRAPAHRTGVMNLTESAFHLQVLAPRLLLGIATQLLFERVQWWLAPGLTYRPDFIEVLPCGAWWCWEVKGPRIEEDATVKFKAAAEAYPWVRWTMVQRAGKGEPWRTRYDRGATDRGAWPDAVLPK